MNIIPPIDEIASVLLIMTSRIVTDKKSSDSESYKQAVTSFLSLE